MNYFSKICIFIHPNPADASFTIRLEQETLQDLLWSCRNAWGILMNEGKLSLGQSQAEISVED
ncbi:MAG: hypothetical protein HC880_19665 [Bacteroidia bacterium]|nr:hypothetical protein [Bacteroidia bacterium]